jgi:hypothetical protein
MARLSASWQLGSTIFGPSGGNIREKGDQSQSSFELVLERRNLMVSDKKMTIDASPTKDFFIHIL